jgi:hypothetical protein
MADGQPPIEIQQAAAKVQSWLDSRKPASPPRPETAAERFRKMPRADVPAAMPSWKDPRGT